MKKYLKKCVDLTAVPVPLVLLILCHPSGGACESKIRKEVYAGFDRFNLPLRKVNP